MSELQKLIADVRRSASALKLPVAACTGDQRGRLREALFQLEAALHLFERAAAEAANAVVADRQPRHR